MTRLPKNTDIPFFGEEKTAAHIMASVGLSLVSTAAHISCLFSSGLFGELDKVEVVGVIAAQALKVQEGNMHGVESMLIAQAFALNTVFTEMMRKAAETMDSHPQASDMYMRLAFKAQAQCRATLETLSDVKNPRVTNFVRQQNNANLQQVNNMSLPCGNPPRAGKNINQSNELLSEVAHAPLDSKRTETTGSVDT